jgi:hypothetical protein
MLNLIEEQLRLAPGVEAIMVVWGFSNSPYLMSMIRDAFSLSVKHIMMSRKSRKTYGIASSRAFQMGDPSDYLFIDEDGRARCKNTFSVFPRIGEDILVNHHVINEYSPISGSTKKF